MRQHGTAAGGHTLLKEQVVNMLAPLFPTFLGGAGMGTEKFDCRNLVDMTINSHLLSLFSCDS